MFDLNVIKDSFVEWGKKLTDQKELGKAIRAVIYTVGGAYCIKSICASGLEYGKLKIGVNK